MYQTYSALTERLRALALANPAKIKMTSIGRTEGGRDLWLMTVTAFDAHAEDARPAVWVDGNTHASELAGGEACLHLISRLLGEPALLESTTFYIVPRISVDGAEHVLTRGEIVRSTPEVYPGDHPFENFTPRDLDGDNEILFMRIEDPGGLFKVSPDDPRLMVARRPEDDGPGPYYDLIPEGVYENFDQFTRRHHVEKRYDLNRQSPSGFEPRERGAGPVPLALSEARALAEAFLARVNIGVCVTHHTYGGYLLRPSSVEPDERLPRFDREVYKVMGEMGERVTGYPAISVFHEFTEDPDAPTRGAWDDWHYYHRGAFSWTSEIWSLPRTAGVDVSPPLRIYYDLGPEKLLRVLRWCDQNLAAGSYFREWRAFAHPQLGAVEIGGWRTLFSWRNPPPALLEAELEKMTAFTLNLARHLPRLAVVAARVEELGGDLRRASVVIENRGFLPTYISESGRSLPDQRPRARIELGAARLVAGDKQEQWISHLDGRANQMFALAPVVGTPPGEHQRQTLHWTLRGAGPVKIEIIYPRAGRLQIDLE